PTIISFLARLLGLTGIAEKIKETIKKIQDTVDKAIDKLIDKIVKGIGKLFGKGKDGKPDERTEEQKKADLHRAVVEAEGVMDQKGASPESVRAKLPAIQTKYRLVALTLEKDAETAYHVKAKINPDEVGMPKKLTDLGLEIV